MAGRSAKDPESLSYEAAAAELEALVKKMEEGGLSLEESVTSYARGVQLSRVCRKRLEDAEAAVKKLDADGTLRDVSPEELRSDSSGSGTLRTAERPAENSGDSDIPF